METRSNHRVRFKSFELDLSSRELRRNGLKLKLQGQPVEVLAMLLDRPGEVVTREEMRRRLWPGDTFVDFEHGLNSTIRRLREALGDSAEDPRYIETLPRLGYRFIASIESANGSAGNLASIASTPNGQVGYEAEETQTAELPVAEEVAPVPASGRPGSSVRDSATPSNLKILAMIGATAAVVAGLVLGSRLLFFGEAHALTDKDTIVLADFENSTGEAVFDGTLRQGLELQLEQSPFLALVSDGQIERTLHLMGQPAGARLTPQIARLVCQRTSSAAIVEGSIAPLGSQYVLGLKAIDCQTGGSLAREQVQAVRKEDVLKSLSRASEKLREKLGESLSMVKRFDTPLEQATTPSLEALQAYTLGRRELIWGGNLAAAAQLFQSAIDLDPNFAMARLSLGLCYVNMGETGLAAESIRRAYELREQVSQWEKFAIESRYYLAVVGDLAKARQVYELWAKLYPREFIPWSVLGQELDPELGQYDRALEELRHALSLSPTNPESYEALFVGYLSLDQLQMAQATAEDAAKKRLDSTDLHLYLYQLAFLQKNERGMAKEVEWAAGKEGLENVLLACEADTAAFKGRLRNAREFSDRAINSAKQAGEKETAAGYLAQSAIRDALFGYPTEARKQAAAALKLSDSRDVESRAALAFALAGDSSQHLADDLARRFPENTLVQFNYLPTIRAQLALNSGDASKAIQQLRAASPYELGNLSPDTPPPFALYPVYVRGNAFLASRAGSEAANEFEKILKRPGVVLNGPIGPPSRLGLARAYTLQGDTAKAKAAYQEFFALWNEADADISILRQAKTEFAKLR